MPGARAGIPTHIAVTGTHGTGAVTVDGFVFSNADDAAEHTADIHNAAGATNLVMRVVVGPDTVVPIPIGMRFNVGLHLVLGNAALTATVIEA